ncbi:hypothetical protein INS49_001603 [Diaporthe citri]|uniref:uncharacterized protein n=1 Tax=Diaporthe citri TaxID=83186 RepID=UPI001C7E33CE|nr:uncharacterized protein INS49_001603 [Diaporthe citri]KAG6367414.1 hypothetical protein INS49_001603 [Diaporthe citri]
MKINTATLALLATTAAAVPMSAADMIGRQVTTVETTTTSSKTVASASPNGPGEEDKAEACIMPNGCRDEDKHDGDAWHPRTTPTPPPKVTPHDGKIWSWLVPTATSSATGVFSVVPEAEPTSA